MLQMGKDKDKDRLATGNREEDDRYHRQDQQQRRERDHRRDIEAEVDGHHRSSKRSRDGDRHRRRRSRSVTPSSSSSSPSSSPSPSSDRSRSSRSRSRSPDKNRHRHHQRSRHRDKISDSSEDEDERKKQKRSKKRHPPHSSSSSSTREAHKLAKHIAKHGTVGIITPITSSIPSLHGYTNDSNPFNDSNLTSTFIWKKKVEQSLQAGKVEVVSESGRLEKQQQLSQEIEQVKARRIQRAEEKVALELMREQLEREAAAEQIEGWEEKEESFHRQQARLKTKIRLIEGREKAIDLLVKNISVDQWRIELEEQERLKKVIATMEGRDEEEAARNSKEAGEDGISTTSTKKLMQELTITDPIQLLSQLPLSDLLDLHSDLLQQLSLQDNPLYWQSLLLLCEDEIRLAKRLKKLPTMNEKVLKQIDQMLEKKSLNELERLETQIQITLNRESTPPTTAGWQDGGLDIAVVDVVYWEAVLAELKLYKAIAFLRQFYQQLKQDRAKQQKAEKEKQRKGKSSAARSKDEQEMKDDEDEAEKQELQRSVMDPSSSDVVQSSATDEMNVDHCLSPRLFSLDEELDVPIITEAADAAQLHSQRQQVRSLYPLASTSSSSSSSSTTFSETLLPDEIALIGDIPLPPSLLNTNSKYRPRKPRYFNRVLTGYSWNKYNQTHYDKENPPPKIVQGYKFNLFYPDLVDSTVAPTYQILPDPSGDPQYCLLRFSAGPPYEDVAFKIVRKQWEYQPRRGFKCIFDKGILQLYFNFKRYFYRR